MRALLLFCALLLAAPLLAQPALPPPAPIVLDEAGEARYRRFIHELRCLVCQNQTIADSSAPLAQDLRQQVRQRIAGGQDDEAIRTYLTDRYGDFVLYNPPFRARTALLWLAPALLVLAGLFMALRLTRRAGLPPSPPDAAALQRLLDDPTDTSRS